MKHSLLKVVMCSAMLVSPLPMAGQAAAQPFDGPLIDTTCSYAQLRAAVRAEAPEAAARLAQRPQALARLQELVALPVDQRRQRVQVFFDRNPDVRTMVEQNRGTPEGQKRLQTMARIADTCHNY